MNFACFQCRKSLPFGSIWQWVYIDNAPAGTVHRLRLCAKCAEHGNEQEVFQNLMVIHRQEGRDIYERA